MSFLNRFAARFGSPAQTPSSIPTLDGLQQTLVGPYEVFSALTGRNFAFLTPGEVKNSYIDFGGKYRSEQGFEHAGMAPLAPATRQFELNIHWMGNDNSRFAFHVSAHRIDPKNPQASEDKPMVDLMRVRGQVGPNGRVYAECTTRVTSTGATNTHPLTREDLNGIRRMRVLLGCKL